MPAGVGPGVIHRALNGARPVVPQLRHDDYGTTGLARMVPRSVEVCGFGLERTCRLKSMLGRSASPNATHFGPIIV